VTGLGGHVVQSLIEVNRRPTAGHRQEAVMALVLSTLHTRWRPEIDFIIAGTLAEIGGQKLQPLQEICSDRERRKIIMFFATCLPCRFPRSETTPTPLADNVFICHQHGRWNLRFWVIFTQNEGAAFRVLEPTRRGASSWGWGIENAAIPAVLHPAKLASSP
jgi:hypothetical protein